jgi:glycosyltransferase involved in cell wall biosynthesis
MIIGVLTTSYPSGPGDPAGAFVADRVAALLGAGHQVEVLAGGAAAHTDAGGRGAARVTRLPAHVGVGPDLFTGAGAPEALERGSAALALGALRFSAALASTVAARAPGWDRVESHWLAPCALAGLAGAPGLPHRAHAHSGDVALLERVPLGRALARRLAASRVELVFVSEDLRSRFGRLAGCPRGIVQTLAVPSALFSPAAAPRAPARIEALLGRAGGFAIPTAVAVGRLVPIKGFDLLVRACAARAGAPSIPLVVVGDGPERTRLLDLAGRLGVSLALPGPVPRHQVAAWLRVGQVYVQPSRILDNGRTEGMPMATLEALAVGLPVVASASGGLAELARRGADVTLFPPGDAAALGRVLRQRLDRAGRGALSLANVASV